MAGAARPGQAAAVAGKAGGQASQRAAAEPGGAGLSAHEGWRLAAAAVLGDPSDHRRSAPQHSQKRGRRARLSRSDEARLSRRRRPSHQCPRLAKDRAAVGAPTGQGTAGGPGRRAWRAIAAGGPADSARRPAGLRLGGPRRGVGQSTCW
jgi:hypothetical protein